ncbi:hypothetical protein [Methylovirgula sp. HY1]|uniref:hypothetical protein n=1 Tax=Methylovirgula sp. HY1 TaxID=2822761 RepID=UPI001C5AD463|nr:hypothetical protein [Methylovirgula sp. HY1]QXX73885.1 hypothetical protein MHY1_00686 [Methylovirgula sp. HY1]
MSDRPKAPKELDVIADVVLAYKPKPKSEPAKKRKKKAKAHKTQEKQPESHPK